MFVLAPQSGNSSGATLGVRSVVLLQIPKPAGKLLITSFELGTIVLSRPMGSNDQSQAILQHKKTFLIKSFSLLLALASHELLPFLLGEVPRVVDELYAPVFALLLICFLKILSSKHSIVVGDNQ